MIDGAQSRQGSAGLRRTYLSLGTGELAAVVVFVVVQPMVAGRLGDAGGRALWWAVAPLLDPVLLAGCLAGVLLTGADSGALVLCLLVWAFGVLEYVNYFVARLSYPVTQWFARVGRWRTPVLVQDVARAL